MPFFRNFSPLTQFFTVFSMHFLGYMLSAFFLFLALKPIFGVNILANPELLLNYNDPTALQLNRLIFIVNILFVFFLPAMIFRRLMELEGQDYLVIRTKPKLKTMGWVTILLVLAFIAGNFLYFLNSEIDLSFVSQATADSIRETEEEAGKFNLALLRNDDFSVYIINLFSLAILTAIGEEMVFRGVFQRLLIKMTGNLHWGIILGALIFSLAHFNYSGFLTRFFLGMVLGYIYVSTANLWYCIWFHFLNNGIAITFAWITARGTDMSYFDMAGFYGWTQWLGLGILFILILFAITRIKKLINYDFVGELKEF